VLLTYGARATVLGVIMSFETALIKYVGGIAIAFISAYLLQRFLVPMLSRQLRLRTEPAPPSARSATA
jgi:cytochrome c biogenesis protein CcdA